MSSRRTFLRQLVGLPLIGGAVSLIGAPSAVAEPVTFDLLETYKTWLNFEFRELCLELATRPEYIDHYRGFGKDQAERFDVIRRHINYAGESRRYHYTTENQPSERAALVLSTVGCQWRSSDI